MQKVNNIDKAYKLFEEYKEIRKCIERINEMAEAIAADGKGIKVSVSCERKKNEKPEPVLDEDGSLITRRRGSRRDFLHFRHLIIGADQGPVKKETAREKVSLCVDEAIALSCLGVLLGEKSRQLDEIVIKLKKMGFAI